MMGRLFQILSFCLIIVRGILTGEVEKITLTWNALQCMEMCIPGIERNLLAIRHAHSLQINSRSGVAVMGWDPNYPFNYETFRYAMAGAGINIDEMRLRVRGTIAHDRDNFYLISNGDESRFLIIGPIRPEPGRNIPINIVSYPLNADEKALLLDAERNGHNVTIAGPLFQPIQFPRTLIAEQIKIHMHDSLMDPRFRR